MTDKQLSATEAVKMGFANGIINGIEVEQEFIDPSLIPVIPKFLSYDLETIKHNMEQMNLSKDLKRIKIVNDRECEAIIAR